MSLFKKRVTTTGPQTEESGERRQLTVLFYDIVGSTSLIAGTDPEDLRATLQAIHHAARTVLTAHGGVLEQVMGDGGMAYFGYPTANEDAAADAVAAALALLGAREQIAGAPAIRIGVATSVVVLPDTPAAGARLGAVGVAPNLAARLEAAAAPNTALVGQTTYALSKRAADFAVLDGLDLKGFPDVTRAYAPLTMRPGETRFDQARDGTVPLIGRTDERRLLRDAWARASNGRGGGYLIEGEPGIGKSRIAADLLAGAHGARKITLQCQPRTQGEALFSIIRMYDRAYEDGSDAALCDAAQATADHVMTLDADEGLNAEAKRAAMLAGVTDILEALSRDRPLLLLAEDLHWADEVTLDVLDRLCRRAPEFAIMILATARPGPTLAPIRESFRTVPLSPVGHDDARALIASAADPVLSPATRAWIADRADGNPLFVLELTAHANDVAKSGGTLEGGTGATVTSLRDLLAARLESAGRARQTARIASVLGREYPYHLLARLAADTPASALDADLARLHDHGLKDPVGNGYAYAFRHALIRDVAYDSQLRSVRRGLHRRIVALVDDDPNLAADVPDSLMAEHCLAADMTARGLGLLIKVAEDAIRRSAIHTPRLTLERVLGLSDDLPEGPARDLIRLQAIALLGPLVSLLDGPRAAGTLYQRGQKLYFALPEPDRTPFFPILWGWWFTASDLVEQTRRSEILIRDVAPDADPESRLQALHCGWATLFDGGAHDRCLSAIADGLSLYDTDIAVRSRHLYGHDARVCGLGERALSGWLTGRLALSTEAVRHCEEWADETDHLASRLHGLDIATQVAFFRHDLPEIDRTLSKMAALSGAEAAPAIAAKRRIFRGWMAARAGDAGQMAAVNAGLRALRDFGVLEDTPFYADIAASVAAAHGPADVALGPLDDEIAEARSTGLTYWLPELLRRRAVILGGAEAAAALDDGFEVAQAHNAQMLALRNVATRLDLGLSIPPEVARRMAERIGHIDDCALRRKVADGLAL